MVKIPGSLPPYAIYISPNSSCRIQWLNRKLPLESSSRALGLFAEDEHGARLRMHCIIVLRRRQQVARLTKLMRAGSWEVNLSSMSSSKSCRIMNILRLITDPHKCVYQDRLLNHCNASPNCRYKKRDIARINLKAILRTTADNG